MYVARILYPVEVLGPGKRVGIWFSGCPRRCKGCSNPELWEFHEQYQTTPEQVVELIQCIAANHVIDGFTLTGGDPVYQPEDLQVLIPLLKRISKDVLVYTGYRIEDLSEDLLQGITVLIDGEYIESRNTNCVFSGCKNLEHIDLPETLQFLGNGAFRNSGITDVIIPESINKVPSQCFYGCNNLEKVVFGKSVRVIGESAFEKCENLRTISLPDSLEEIGGHAFSETSIRTYIFPKSVINISKNAISQKGQADQKSVTCVFLGMDTSIENSDGGIFKILGGVSLIYCLPGSKMQQIARRWSIPMKPLSEFRMESLYE